MTQKIPDEKQTNVALSLRIKPIILGGLNLLISVLLSLALIVGTLKFFPESERILFRSSEKIGVLDERIESFEETLKTLKANIQNLELATSKIVGIETQISHMNDALSALKEAHDESARRIAQIKLADGSQSVESVRGQWERIKELYAKGEPFQEELVAMIPHLGHFKEAIEALHSLSVHSKAEVMTRQKLHERLLKIEEVLIGKATPDELEGGWLTRLIKKLKSLVTVRKIDEPKLENQSSDKSVELQKAVQEASKYTQTGDIKKALDLLGPKILGARSILEPWAQEAQRRLDLDHAFEPLRKLMISYLS
jgi:hypothetical protein